MHPPACTSSMQSSCTSAHLDPADTMLPIDVNCSRVRRPLPRRGGTSPTNRARRYHWQTCSQRKLICSCTRLSSLDLRTSNTTQQRLSFKSLARFGTGLGLAIVAPLFIFISSRCSCRFDFDLAVRVRACRCRGPAESVEHLELLNLIMSLRRVHNPKLSWRIQRAVFLLVFPCSLHLLSLGFSSPVPAMLLAVSSVSLLL